MPGLVGDQILDQFFFIGGMSLRHRFFFYVIERKAINAEGLSTPKVDDTVRWLVERTIGTRYTQWTRLDDDVAREHGSLDEPGVM
jgi:hypothetical protein